MDVIISPPVCNATPPPMTHVRDGPRSEYTEKCDEDMSCHVKNLQKT